MKKIVMTALVIGLVSAASTFASDVYNAEMNAIRDRERIYVADMKMKWSATLIFERRWKMIQDELDSVKLSLNYTISENVPTFMPDTPSNRLFMRMVSEKGRLEHAAESLAIAETSIRHFINLAEDAVRSAGFNDESPIIQLHGKNEVLLTAAIENIKAKISTAQVRVNQTLTELMDFNQKALVRSEMESHKKVISDIQYSHLFFKMAEYFNGIFDMFTFHCKAKKNLAKAEEYLVAYEWLRNAVPQFMGTKIDSDHKRREYDLMMSNTKGRYAVMLSQYHALKERQAQDPTVVSKQASKLDFLRMSYMAGITSHDEAGDDDSGFDGSDHDSGGADDFEVPDNENGSKSCRSDHLTIGGKDYSSDSSRSSDMKYFREGTEVGNPDHGMAIEHDSNGDVTDTQATQNGPELQNRINTDMNWRMWEVTETYQGSGKPWTNDYSGMEGLREPTNPESNGSDLDSQTSHMREMVARAKGRTSNNEHINELEKLGAELDRFTWFQKALNAHIGARLAETLISPVNSQMAWSNFSADLNIKIPENTYIDPSTREQIKAEFDASVRMMTDVALGIAGGVAYDGASLLAAVALGQDLMGNSTDAMDKMLLGAAVVLGMVEPAGSKGPVLRAIRNALKNGKISKEAAVGLKEMAKHAPEATKDLMKSGEVAKKAGIVLHDIAKKSPRDVARYSKLMSESAGKTIKTPYGDAVQDISREALDAREAAINGAPMYRVGNSKTSKRSDGQFWSLEHPKNFDYASRHGIPPKNTDFDFIDDATAPKDGKFISRPAPGSESNPGGAIEIVVDPGTVENYRQGPY